MKIKQWKQPKWNQLCDSIRTHWKMNDIHTHSLLHPPTEHPYYIANTSPICTKIIRKLYRIQTYGFICKVQLEAANRKAVFTKSFIKEISLESEQNSPNIELYATMCASYLRHTKKTPGLALCYGFVSGHLRYFTTDIHTSSLVHTGLRVRKIGDKYSQIERVNEPVYLLMQEYVPLTFDDVMEEWKSMEDTEAASHLSSMLLQIAKGLHQMETEWGIYHNDLHLGNVMAHKRKDGTYQWTIIDWGRATIQRKGCQVMNQTFKTGCGAAYGQLKMADFPLQPNSDIQYTQAASGGDLVCLLTSLLWETYIAILLQKVSIPTLWFPNPPIRGDGLHCFRQANDWAAKHSDQISMESFIDTLSP